MQRRLFLSAMAAGTLGLTGCMTDALVRSIRSREYRDSKEKITHFLVSADGRQLVVLGGEYHYVFAPAALLTILGSALRPLLRAEFTGFVVDLDGTTHGNYVLHLDAAADETMRSTAKALGFHQRGDGAMRYEGGIRGQRYAAGKFTLPAVAQPLNREYTIAVSEERSGALKSVGYLLTPVTVAADGIFWVVGVPLIVLGLVLTGP